MKKPNTNILYFFGKGRDYTQMRNILDKLEIEYVGIKLTKQKITKDFISMMLDFTENGFEDIMKSWNKIAVDVDFDELSTNQLIDMIVLEPTKFLKDVWVLGKNGILKSTKIEDELTVLVDYEKREMSKIYE